MPMALSHLALALWLMIKGFEERRHPFRAGPLETDLPRASVEHESEVEAS
jgi:hypothetical protein